MCGRFAFYSPAEAVTALFGVEGHIPVEPRYNIAPTQFVAAVRHGRDEERELAMLRWGLVPFWAKDTSIGNRMINARAETVTEKPAYRAAYRKRRCVVLADGYYEWHRRGSDKTPYFVSSVNSEPFAFAALWESWHDEASDQSLETTVIVTTAANAFMERLHDRMPLVLGPKGAARWLRGDTDLLEAQADAAPKMQAWPVSLTVNNARNEGEQLIEPAGSKLI